MQRDGFKFNRYNDSELMFRLYLSLNFEISFSQETSIFLGVLGLQIYLILLREFFLLLIMRYLKIKLKFSLEK